MIKVGLSPEQIKAVHHALAGDAVQLAEDAGVRPSDVEGAVELFGAVNKFLAHVEYGKIPKLS